MSHYESRRGMGPLKWKWKTDFGFRLKVHLIVAGLVLATVYFLFKLLIG